MNKNITSKSLYHQLAKKYSSVKFMGPPFDDKLITLLAHIFDKEEAFIVTFMSLIKPINLNQLSKKSKCHKEYLKLKLEKMRQKKTILDFNGKYMLYPLLPGMFERILLSGDETPWHRRFSELASDIFAAGYLKDYFKKPIHAVRSIPVQKTISSNNYALDTDKISELVESHKYFGVFNSCACRHSRYLVGEKCSRASHTDGCLTFGEYSQNLGKDGGGRSISKSEMIDIIAERSEKNLIFITSNIGLSQPTGVCTCCDCCCHALMIQNKFNGQLIAPSHFKIKINTQLCSNCGNCYTACNTEALNYQDNKLHYNSENCVGCGNCLQFCSKKAISMELNPKFKTPPKNYTSLILKLMPSVIKMGSRLKIKRIFKF
jgi:Pyruvate/2-oxoacid:ferredoxin oxidoreductase delta subunit